MKEIKAFIKPKRVQNVIEALSESGFKSMTLSQGEGTGAFKAKGITFFRFPCNRQSGCKVRTGMSKRRSTISNRYYP